MHFRSSPTLSCHFVSPVRGINKLAVFFCLFWLFWGRFRGRSLGLKVRKGDAFRRKGKRIIRKRLLRGELRYSRLFEGEKLWERDRSALYRGGEDRYSYNRYESPPCPAQCLMTMWAYREEEAEEAAGNLGTWEHRLEDLLLTPSYQLFIADNNGK